MTSSAQPTTNRNNIARAAALVMGFFILSRALGLLREVVIGAQFGTSAELDAYLAAFRVPDLLFQLVAGGALGSAFIPAFTGRLVHGDRAAAWRLASAVANLMVLVLTIVAVLAAISAPWLVRHLLAPGFSVSQQALTVGLMRLMLISTIIFGVSGLVMGALNAMQHFLAPAAAPVIYNLAIIGGASLLGKTLGVRGLAIGVLVGAVGHLLVQTPALIRRGARYTPVLDVRDAAVREIGRLMAPRVLGLAAVQLNFWVNTILASGLPEGRLAALNYGWLIMLLPQGIFAQAVATVAFPTFAAQVAHQNLPALRRTFTTSLRTILFFTLPAAIGLILLARPLITVLLQRNAFTADSTALVATALQLYALGLVGHSVVEIAARAFYALHDTATPVVVGGGAMLLNIVLSLLLLGPLQHGGLALANSIATTLEMIALLWLLRKRMGGLEAGTLASSLWRTGLASLALGIIVWGWQQAPGVSGAWLKVLFCLPLGAGVYLAVAWLTQAEELQALRHLLRR
ncbi:murein biosynthesis integral membrane protein MurJ [Candidatus Amarolinea aalborgensis]|jgi:putative peptidoglycan lipid II flippase|uniref:murein biosynthesis integral membrane protein MurJ n=1 Tax=Candidatus Amarolinea aalborgensis TaxID=2249329 RepID=UPI003BF960BC